VHGIQGNSVQEKKAGSAMAAAHFSGAPAAAAQISCFCLRIFTMTQIRTRTSMVRLEGSF